MSRKKLKRKAYSRPRSAGLRLKEFTRVPELSHGRARSGNYLFHGENLDVLNALLPKFENTIKCVYIDPPYNNGERYAHYDDQVDHVKWLPDLRARLELLSAFLRNDGSIWISIDDSEVHYLKVLADSVFGRDNFITTVIWQHRTTRENRKVFSNNHEYLLVYAKNRRFFSKARNGVIAPPELLARYQNPDNDIRGPWQSISANVQAGHATKSQFYVVTAPNGRKHSPPKGRCWVYNKRKMEEAITRNDVWFGRDGNGVPRLKRFLTDARLRLTPETLWTAEDAGTTLAAKKHLLQLFPDHIVFDTPKPESLIRRILEIATDPGELVLDAYLGSGTTAAVAHKLGRRYVGIEAGEHAITHCAFRLEQVVGGELGGISNVVAWRGGGGFDFFKRVTVAPSNEAEKKYLCRQR